ncbi:unnamed protein product, partial [Polarella glacialis]
AARADVAAEFLRQRKAAAEAHDAEEAAAEALWASAHAAQQFETEEDDQEFDLMAAHINRTAQCQEDYWCDEGLSVLHEVDEEDEDEEYDVGSDDLAYLEATQEAEAAATRAQEALEAARLAEEKAKSLRKTCKTGRSPKASQASPVRKALAGEEAKAKEKDDPPVEVLICLDTSFAMHAPETIAHRAVSEWGEEDWDYFGRHLRTRSEPCRLESLGLQALGLLAAASRGLAVEVRLCGADAAPGEAERHCPLDEEKLGRQWKRALRRGADVWRHLVADVERLKERGLRSVVVVTGTELPDESSDDNNDNNNNDINNNNHDNSNNNDNNNDNNDNNDNNNNKLLSFLTLAGLPVHVVTLSLSGASSARELA